MEIILLENILNLGKLGEVVKVKSGFGRNFLLPKKKALRATKENIEFNRGTMGPRGGLCVNIISNNSNISKL